MRDYKKSPNSIQVSAVNNCNLVLIMILLFGAATRVEVGRVADVSRGRRASLFSRETIK